MEEIIKKNWNYILYKTDGEYFLSVVCGTVAIFDRNIRLYPDELQKYVQHGEKYTDELARKICYSPDSFSNRHLQWFDKHTAVTSLKITLENNGEIIQTAQSQKGNQQNNHWVDILYNISPEIIEALENPSPKKEPPSSKRLVLEINLNDRIVTAELPINPKPKTLLDYFAHALETRFLLKE